VPLDDERICSVLGRRTVQEDFARIGIMRLSEIYSLRIMADESVRRYAGIGPTNTEDLPLLEFQAPRAFFVNRGVSSILLADERMKLGVPLGLLSRARADGKLRDEDLRSIGMLHTRKNRGNLSFGSAALRAYLERHPADVDVLNRLEGVAGQMHDLPEQIELLRRLVALEPRNFPLHERYAWARYSLERSRANVLTGFDIEPYVVMLRGCIQASADTVDRYRIRLGDVYYHAQEYGKAVDQYARALQIRAAYADDPEFPDDVVLLQLARCLHELHQTERALGYAFRASVVNRNNADVSDFIYQVWMRRRAAAPDTAGRN
jgi:tetratricopeptide (TPR) repeat protein